MASRFIHVPKIELHAHLNGSIPPETMRKLLSQHSGYSEKSITQDLSIDNVFERFALIHKVCNSVDVIKEITEAVIIDFAKDNVVYLELRSSLKSYPEKGTTKLDYLKAVLDVIKRSNSDTTRNIHVLFLPSIDRARGVGDAEDTLTVVEPLLRDPAYCDVIGGLDLSGDPAKGHLRDFLPLLRRATDMGLKVTAHLGEIAGSAAETLEVLSRAKIHRIGHGTFLQPERGGDQKVVDLVRSGNILLEFCLTSNLQCGTVSDPAGHQLGRWAGHPLCLCTDDRGVFDVTLSQEYQLAADTFSLDEAYFRDMNVRAMEHAFCSDDVRRVVQAKLTSAV